MDKNRIWIEEKGNSAWEKREVLWGNAWHFIQKYYCVSSLLSQSTVTYYTWLSSKAEIQLTKVATDTLDWISLPFSSFLNGFICAITTIKYVNMNMNALWKALTHDTYYCACVLPILNCRKILLVYFGKMYWQIQM